MKQLIVCYCCFFLLCFLGGCLSLRQTEDHLNDALSPTDVRLIRHHVAGYFSLLEDFTCRLYAKNPKYEPDLRRRKQKINQIFSHGRHHQQFQEKSSAELLTAAFAPQTTGDRVYLLCLGLTRSIKEAYQVTESGFFISGLQIPDDRLNRLYANISQVNWRLKTYHDQSGDLLFLTNAGGENGYINMGYEVIMTRILTGIEDDIFLLGGLPEKEFFNMSAIFLSILL